MASSGRGNDALLRPVGLPAVLASASLGAHSTRAGRPPSPARRSPQVPAGGRRRGRATSPRGRSPVTRCVAGTTSDDASVADGDAEREAVSYADVVDKVKRSSASVRAGLTEQRAQSVELARQMAAGRTKMDQLTVVHESVASARVADQATMATMMQRLDEVKDMLAAVDGVDGGAESDTAEDPKAWVPLVKECSLSACRQFPRVTFTHTDLVRWECAALSLVKLCS